MVRKAKAPSRKLLTEIAEEENLRLADDPNIACVGIGLKFVKGKPTPQACLQYHVHSKLESDKQIKAHKSKPIPKEMGGYLTDVREWRIMRTAACPGSKSPTGERGGRKEDPLVGGTSTTVLADFHSFPTGYGTLGGICTDAGSMAPMALSNAHVYGTDVGNDVIQPWLPTSEYLEAGLKYLFCGGPASHLFFWTAPSPLTTILTSAAAAAWIAAAASDAEDPSRWGQRKGPVPPVGEKTEQEVIHLEAEVPHMPFPGRVWKTKTSWDYTRKTDAGQSTVSLNQTRPNEHVLIGKRVFTDRETYVAGDRVTICAELWSGGARQAPNHFVVAHSFPIAAPDRIYRRILAPGIECARLDAAIDEQRRPSCLDQFAPQVLGLVQMVFPIVQGVFRLWSEAGETVLDGTALVIPKVPVNIACPPSTHVSARVKQRSKPIRIRAFSANGTVIDESASTGSAATETVQLSGPEITRVSIEGGGGDGLLAGICVDKRRLDPKRWKGLSQYYCGGLDLLPSEPNGKWAVVVVAQTMDDTPTGGDPITAARRLSGIAASANVTEVGECACSILFDATFDIVDPAPIILR